MILTVDQLKQELSVLPDEAEIMLKVRGEYGFAQGVILETEDNETWVTINTDTHGA